jgi:hypothetical protein
MKTIGIISTAALALLLGVPALSYAQDDKDQRPEEKQEQKDKPAETKAPEEKTAKPEEKAAQQDKNAKQEDKNTQQEDKNKQQEDKNAQQQDRNTKQEEKSTQQQDKNNRQQQKNAQQAQGGNHGGRIPDDRFQANFGRQHSFHVSQSDYSRDRRFEYGGYSFGFVDAWPGNWLYTQDVYVVEIDGVYYLCNASYPGVNVALSINL